MLAENDILQERYRITRTIGQGGMGAVYMARDLRLNNVVALKENFFTDDKMVRAFEHEAQLLAGLRHAALPKVFDHFSEDNKQYLIMEYISGDDFAEVLRKRYAHIPPAGVPKPFDVADVITWAKQLLDALDYLHNQSHPIIHRDIKPQNLKLGHRNQVTLLDFGLAKGSSSESSLLRTTSGSVAGYTPSYAPIEQIQGSGTDPRTDLYSLAATLYHLVTGLPPTGAAIRAEAFLGHEPDPLRRPHLLNPKVPLNFSHLLMRALEQHRNNRPSSAAEMLDALQSVTRPGISNVAINHDPEKYTPTVNDLKAKQRRQAEDEIHQAVQDAENRHQRLEQEVQQARAEAGRLRQQEELARKAREEAEQWQRQEAAARKAREEAEQRRLQLEEQAQKAAEEAQRFQIYEEQARIARRDMEQRRLRPSASYKTRTDENNRMQMLEDQERRARQEAERLRQQLEDQARKAKVELELRRLQEAEAHRAKQEAERLQQEELQRKTREEAERRRLEAELERKAREEAELQRVLGDLEQAAREEGQRQRLLEEEARRAVEETESLKRQLEEQSAKVKAEAERRRQLEAEIQKARDEAERKRREDERKRRQMEESGDFGATAELKVKIEEQRQQHEAQAALAALERRRLEDELGRLTREDAERRKLEKQVRAASAEAELLKQNLEAQEQHARSEAERRQDLETQARAASDELRTLKQLEEERQAKAEAERLYLQEELERVTREETEKNRLLEQQALEAAREASLLRRQIEEQTRRAAQEAALLKQQLEEISRKAAEEAERRRQYEEEMRQEAAKRQQLEAEAQRAREAAEQRRAQEEEQRRQHREAERRQREEQERQRQEEVERLKRELEEQKRRAQQEAKARQLAEAQERQAQQAAESRRLILEQQQQEALLRMQQDSLKYQTREFAVPGFETKPLEVVVTEEVSQPPADSRPLFTETLEPANRNPYIIGIAAGVALLMIVILAILIPGGKTPAMKPGIVSLLSDDSYVKVQKGKFKMGTENSADPEEKPAHLVELTRDYQIGKYEVTQAQWMAIMDENPAQQRGDTKPVTHVIYRDIYEFIAKLNAQDAKYSYDLPTEAEWEYACRAGTTGAYAGKLADLGWYKDNAEGTIHPVGTKAPNAWGIYDMHGNVAEWCKDYYDPNYYQKNYEKDKALQDPECMLTVSEAIGHRVIRGGGYSSPDKNCRSAYRVNNSGNNQSDYVGFRLIRRAKK